MILIESQYLPNLDYFISIYNQDKILIEAKETFQKQSYRNRALILGSNKIQILTVPIKKASDKNQTIADTEIDYATNWVHIHLQSIKSAYGKSPFFEFYFHTFEKILNSKPIHLFDLNLKTLTACLEILKNKIIIEQTNNFKIDYFNELTDLRNKIHPKKNTLNTAILDNISYNQTFGNMFVNNLSIIDLIFNEGNHAKQFLLKTIK